MGLWRRRWLILGLGWLFAIAGWAAIMMIPDRFESRAQIYINTNTSMISVAEGTGAAQDYDKQIRIMREGLLTRGNIEQIIYDTGLDSEIRGEDRLSREISLERLVEGVAASINISSPEEQIFVITYSGPDPVYAERVVSALLDLMIEQDIGAQLQENERSIKKAQDSLKEWEQKLQSVEAEEARFKQVNKEALASSQDQGRRLEIRLVNLESVNARLSSAQRRRDSLLSQLSSVPQYTAGSELDKLKLELATLESQYNDNFPDIINLKARIAELEQGGSALPVNPEYTRLAVSLQQANSEIADLQAQKRRIDREIEQLTEQSFETPLVAREYANIVREKERYKAGYDDALVRYNKLIANAEINEGGGAIDYDIQEYPKVPAQPSFPPRGLLTFLATFASLGAAGALAFLLAQIDRSFIQRHDIEEAFGLPVLGTISPALTPKYRRTRLMERTGMVMSVALILVMTAALYWYHEIRVEGGGEPVSVSEMPQHIKSGEAS